MRIVRKQTRTRSGPAPAKSVAFFGGSFNPPHQGHVAVVRALLKNKEIDEIWIVPVYRHPFGKELAPFRQRLALCRLALTSLSPRVKLRRIEEKLGGRSFTVRTLRALKRRYSRTHFFLVIGSDAYRQRAQWKDFQTIEKLADILVVPRVGGAVSSTKIRARLKKAQSITDLVPAKAAQYIRDKKLYL